MTGRRPAGPTSGRPIAPVPPATKMRMRPRLGTVTGTGPSRGGSAALAGWRGERARRVPRRAAGVVPGPGRRPGPALVGRLRLDRGDRAARTTAAPSDLGLRTTVSRRTGSADHACRPGRWPPQRLSAYDATPHGRAPSSAMRNVRRRRSPLACSASACTSSSTSSSRRLQSRYLAVGHQFRLDYEAAEHSHARTHGPSPLSLTRALLVSLVFVVAVIFALIWQHRAASAGRALGLPASHSPAWGVGSWFVPIVNLWMPYQALRDCLPPGDPRRPWSCAGGLRRRPATLVVAASGSRPVLPVASRWLRPSRWHWSHLAVVAMAPGIVVRIAAAHRSSEPEPRQPAFSVPAAVTVHRRFHRCLQALHFVSTPCSREAGSLLPERSDSLPRYRSSKSGGRLPSTDSTGTRREPRVAEPADRWHRSTPCKSTRPGRLPSGRRDARPSKLTSGSRGRIVMSDVDVALARGSITALIGPTGSGKSTFLRTLNRMNDRVPGFQRTGDVTLDDVSLWAPHVDLLTLRRRVGMLFQRPNPFPMSIRDNVVAGVKAHRIAKGKQLDVVAERRLTEVGLWDAVKDRLNDSPFRLSGGQQQLLCLARALAVGPEVLLLDEPTSSLDPISTESIEALLRRWLRR